MLDKKQVHTVTQEVMVECLACFNENEPLVEKHGLVQMKLDFTEDHGDRAFFTCPVCSHTITVHISTKGI